MNEELIPVKEYHEDSEGNGVDRIEYEYTTLNGLKHGKFNAYKRELIYTCSFKNGQYHGVQTCEEIKFKSIKFKNEPVNLFNIYQPIFNAIEKLEASDTLATHLVLEIALSPNKDTVSINVVEEVK